MMLNEDAVLAIAHIVQDSLVMNEATLAGDFDEARLRARLIAGHAGVLDIPPVVLAANRVVDLLGPIGSVPRQGYGEGMLAIANALDNVRFESL